MSARSIVEAAKKLGLVATQVPLQQREQQQQPQPLQPNLQAPLQPQHEHHTAHPGPGSGNTQQEQSSERGIGRDAISGDTLSKGEWAQGSAGMVEEG